MSNPVNTSETVKTVAADVSSTASIPVVETSGTIAKTRTFESLTGRLLFGETLQHRSVARTLAGVAALILTGFLPVLFDLVRTPLYLAKLIDGKSWSLIDKASDGVKALAAKVNTFCAAPKLTEEQALNAQAKRMIEGYRQQKSNGLFGAVKAADSRDAENGVDEVKAAAEHLVRLANEYVLGAENEEEFAARAEEVKEKVKGFLREAALTKTGRDETWNPNKTLLANNPVLELEDLYEVAFETFESIFLGKTNCKAVEPAFCLKMAKAAKDTETSLDILSRGVKNKTLSPDQAKAAVANQALSALHENLLGGGVPEATEAFHEVLALAVQKSLINAEEAKEIKTGPAVADALADAADQLNKSNRLSPEDRGNFLHAGSSLLIEEESDAESDAGTPSTENGRPAAPQGTGGFRNAASNLFSTLRNAGSKLFSTNKPEIKEDDEKGTEELTEEDRQRLERQNKHDNDTPTPTGQTPDAVLPKSDPAAEARKAEAERKEKEAAVSKIRQDYEEQVKTAAEQMKVVTGERTMERASWLAKFTDLLGIIEEKQDDLSKTTYVAYKGLEALDKKLGEDRDKIGKKSVVVKGKAMDLFVAYTQYQNDKKAILRDDSVSAVAKKEKITKLSTEKFDRDTIDSILKLIELDKKIEENLDRMIVACGDIKKQFDSIRELIAIYEVFAGHNKEAQLGKDTAEKRLVDLKKEQVDKAQKALKTEYKRVFRIQKVEKLDITVNVDREGNKDEVDDILTAHKKAEIAYKKAEQNARNVDQAISSVGEFFEGTEKDLKVAEEEAQQFASQMEAFTKAEPTDLQKAADNLEERIKIVERLKRTQSTPQVAPASQPGVLSKLWNSASSLVSRQ